MTLSTPSSEKVMSVSDNRHDHRESVADYRPQVCRSGNGFVTALHVPERSAADSLQLCSMVIESIKNTGTVPVEFVLI
ncbi:hypothetical protein CSA37_00590 [Candidatus Fermentibacteria bacterium]|nr:MAG: hypothetical protein CSA37_09820 [Candidatus Fermentibacteria bacterium]PIE53696.1 MAG: hypothetical protein CSA37_00590 [Candidatus Fermentibacteria bacterium]